MPPLSCFSRPRVTKQNGGHSNPLSPPSSPASYPLTSPSSQVDSSLVFPLACCAVVVLFPAYKAYSWYTEKNRLKEVERTGIGRGAKGFMTGTKRVALPVHLAARVRLGEYVSPEEITEALQLQKEQEEREERK